MNRVKEQIRVIMHKLKKKVMKTIPQYNGLMVGMNVKRNI